MRILKRILLILTALALIVAPTASAHHSWGDYHWARSANPFTVSVQDNTVGYSSYVNIAESDWSQSSVLDVAAGTGTRQVTVENANYGPTSWVGLASIYIDADHHILSGRVQLNDYYFSQNTYSTWQQYVTCQEIGHTFGLEHQDENTSNTNLGTCMDYSRNPEGGGRNGKLVNTHPNQGDYDQLRCIYDNTIFGQTLSTTTHSCVSTGHLDTTTTGKKCNPNALGCQKHSQVTTIQEALPAYEVLDFIAGSV